MGLVVEINYFKFLINVYTAIVAFWSYNSAINLLIATLKLQSNGPSYSNTVISHCPLMAGLLHVVQRGEDWDVAL